MNLLLDPAGSETLQRYLVFTYSPYWPSGGRFDARYQTTTLEELKALPLDYSPGSFIDVLDLQERRWLRQDEYRG